MNIANFFAISMLISGVLFAQADRWDKNDEDRGRMEMYAI